MSFKKFAPFVSLVVFPFIAHAQDCYVGQVCNLTYNDEPIYMHLTPPYTRYACTVTNFNNNPYGNYFYIAVIGGGGYELTQGQGGYTVTTSYTFTVDGYFKGQGNPYGSLEFIAWNRHGSVYCNPA